MEYLNFHHCNIQVRDLDEAVVFYRDVLGLPIREEDSSTRVGKSVWFDFADKQLHVTVGKYPDAVGQHFGIQVSDIEQTAKELEAVGVTISGRKISGKGAGKRKYMKISDPSGNVIEFLQDIA